MKILFLISILTLFFSCNKDDNNIIILESNNGFSSIPLNLSIVNSLYDDYYSTISSPSIKEIGKENIYTLAFSSNRNSNGEKFDIILKSLNFKYYSNSKVLKIW